MPDDPSLLARALKYALPGYGVDPQSAEAQALRDQVRKQSIEIGMSIGPSAIKSVGSEPLISLFRGEYSGNKGGNFWTPDFEFAKQFTQSGLDKEVKTTQIAAKHIFTPPGELPYAGDPDLVDKAVAMAKKLGFKGVWLSEGAGQPNSVWMIKK